MVGRVRPETAARGGATKAMRVPLNYPDDFDDLIIENSEDLISRPKPIQIAYCLHRLEAEVNNGGFHAFFGNSSGVFVPETLQALASIGATKTRKLLEDALLIAYPSGFPSDSSLHERELSDIGQIEENLAPLDTTFWRYDESLPEMVNAYLAKYR